MEAAMDTAAFCYHGNIENNAKFMFHNYNKILDNHWDQIPFNWQSAETYDLNERLRFNFLHKIQESLECAVYNICCSFLYLLIEAQNLLGEVFISNTMKSGSQEIIFDNIELWKLLKSIFLALFKSEKKRRSLFVIDEPFWYIMEHNSEICKTDIWPALNKWMRDVDKKGVDAVSFSKKEAEDPFIVYFYDLFPE